MLPLIFLFLCFTRCFMRMQCPDQLHAAHKFLGTVEDSAYTFLTRLTRLYHAQLLKLWCIGFNICCIYIVLLFGWLEAYLNVGSNAPLSYILILRPCHANAEPLVYML